MVFAHAVVERARKIIADGDLYLSVHAQERGAERLIKMRDLMSSAARGHFRYVRHDVNEKTQEVIVSVECIDGLGTPFIAVIPLSVDMTHIEPIITVKPRGGR
ncbi:MAG: hypothetical protein Q8P31_11185 [Bacillota bacterium]|nr:hypothetical protein [Bacillota bacterium]